MPEEPVLTPVLAIYTVLQTPGTRITSRWDKTTSTIQTLIPHAGTYYNCTAECSALPCFTVPVFEVSVKPVPSKGYSDLRPLLSALPAPSPWTSTRGRSRPLDCIMT
ncbi:hypothetical protein Hypma_007618 [Hypsizygus marmoreus]|uniref:Uncharacterized protein n=1 Tax=Hypsizygus marmoreus TaxID=39966 RepID=A0A369JT36_HYPMA|nr:hypothetical protein Hypma_007618 [Hypsizygus marmoreus]